MLYILEDFHLGKFYLKNNSHITALTAEPRFVFDQFQKTLKTNTAKQQIQLVSQFSKSFPTSEMHHPIYIKETCALLYALDAFQHDIKNSPLTILVTDSKTSFFLFNADVQNSSKNLLDGH